MTYEEIANRGGGILNSKNSMKRRRNLQSIKNRLEEVMRLGTGARN
jgi:hypothetical protein